MRKLFITFLAFIALSVSSVSQARDNVDEIRNSVKNGGWIVAWGKHVDHLEYFKLLVAMADISGTSVSIYLTDLVAQSASELGREVVIQAIKHHGRTFKSGSVEIQAGIATFNHWHGENPCSIWRGACWIKFPEPNTHQPYVRWRPTKQRIAIPTSENTFVKNGNNGTVTCNTFCNGPKWEGKVGVCKVGYDNLAGQLIGCNDGPIKRYSNSLLGNVSCTCMEISGVHIKTGNNGSVTCDTFCRGYWHDWSGGCLYGWDNKARNNKAKFACNRGPYVMDPLGNATCICKR